MAGRSDDVFPPALRDWIIDYIRIGNQIGRGANGRILEAKWEGTEVAVKEIHSIFMYEVSDMEFQWFKRSFLRECEQSSRLHHPNIVRFFGIYHPPGARVPSLVMELLHCSLTSFLENNPVVPIGTKASIINDVALGLRYLHTRKPPIIHRDLSSNNVLLSEETKGKIGDLGTARLIDPRRQSRMTRAPGTVDFMPPEALEAANIDYGRELDVFSFGCVMLHTLSHEWPTPSQAVIINPDTGLATGGRTEAERRSEYFERIDNCRSDLMITLIESCLNNLPKNRPSMVSVCDQLESQLVDIERISHTVFALQQVIQQKDAEIQKKDTELQRKDTEIQQKDAEILRKDGEILSKDAAIQHLTTTLHEKDENLQSLRSDMAKLQICSLPKNLKANKSSNDFWKSLKLTWYPCTDLPHKCWATSVAVLDEKVYATVLGSEEAYVDPSVYDFSKDQWSTLPALPYAHFSLVTVPDGKQLLAIGGMAKGNGVIEISNKVFLWDEENRKWRTPYPHMPTARYRCSCISHGSTVIVAGGITCRDPWTTTRAVEVLHISKHAKSHWSVVEQLPHVVCGAIPLIVDNKLYITVGYDTYGGASTCNIITASLPELLHSRKNTSGSQVWYKLPDMPYSSLSINHYQGHLITFGGYYSIEKPNIDNPVCQVVPLIHIYNPCTSTWDCVGEIHHEYLLGRSVQLRDNNFLFIGGMTGTCDVSKNEMIKTCSTLALSPQ